MNQEVAGFCPTCGGAGFVVVPLEYANVETGSWCPHCEAGRLLFERVADIVMRAWAEDCPSGLLQTPLVRRHDPRSSEIREGRELIHGWPRLFV